MILENCPFTGLAGEIVIPPEEVRETGQPTVYRPTTQLARNSFCNWFADKLVLNL